MKNIKAALKAYWNALLVLIVIIIVLSAGTALWMYGKEAYAKLFPPPTYAEFLMRNLSVGDVTSTECGTLGQSTEQQQTSQSLADGEGLLGDGLFSPVLQYYTYLYNKHRCIGETSIALFGSWKDGHTDSIIDLSTNKTFVSCTTNYSVVSSGEIFCTDYTSEIVGSNTWDSDYPATESKESQSPYPIYSNTYVELQKLGGD